MRRFPSWIPVSALFLAVLTTGCGYNRIVNEEQQVEAAWGQVESQLQRRADLVPNLVETVKGYAKHEKGVFDDIAAARSAMVGAGSRADKINASNQLDGAISRLLVVSEAYPQLKADQNFLKLQTELAEIEDELQMARRYYNGTVRDFNIAIQTFPDVLIAHAAGMHEEHFFETDAASKAAPVVSLSGA